MSTAQITYKGAVQMQYVIYAGVEVQFYLFLSSGGGAVSLGKRKLCCPYWNRTKTL